MSTINLEEIFKGLFEQKKKLGDIIKEMESPSALDLPPLRRRLPVELECEVFKCLKLPIQYKFIWGMGRGVYGMFGQKLLLRKLDEQRKRAQYINELSHRLVPTIPTKFWV